MPPYADSPQTAAGGSSGGEIVLFGVRVKIGKSLSMNNLSDHLSNPKAVNDAAPKPFARAKPKRGSPSPWTEEEHKQFLIGLEKLGKGDCKGISHDYVKTRTPTQVASHAQKYFLYQSNLNHGCHRRRPSLFAMPTQSVAAMPMEYARNEQQIPAKPASVPQPVTFNAPVLLSMQGGNPLENCQNFLVNNSYSSPMFVHRLEPPTSSRAMAHHNYKHSSQK